MFTPLTRYIIKVRRDLFSAWPHAESWVISTSIRRRASGANYREGAAVLHCRRWRLGAKMALGRGIAAREMSR